MKKNVFYAQSGGVTRRHQCQRLRRSSRRPVSTATSSARSTPAATAFSARWTEDMIDTQRRIGEGHRGTLGTSRAERSPRALQAKTARPEPRRVRAAHRVFKAHDIGYLLLIKAAANSMDTAYKVSQIGRELGYPVVCVGVPKTVDNDLPLTDCCPGFGSVAK